VRIGGILGRTIVVDAQGTLGQPTETVIGKIKVIWRVESVLSFWFNFVCRFRFRTWIGFMDLPNFLNALPS